MFGECGDTWRYRALNARSQLMVGVWLITFPFFIGYQFLVSLDVIPKIFGGYFTFALTLMMPLCIYVYYLQGRRFVKVKGPGVRYGDPIDIFFWLYWLLMLMVFVYAYGGGVEWDFIGSYLAYALKFPVLFIIGRCVPWERDGFGKILWWCFFLSSILIYVMGYFGGGAINVAYQDGEGYIDYHGVALVYAITGVVLAAKIERASRYWVWAVGVLGLYFVGARSEFVGFMFAAMLVEFVRSKIGFSLKFIYVIIPLLFLMSMVLDLGGLSERMVALFNLSEDRSALIRGDQIAMAWSTVEDNFVFGSFGSYEKGNYAHNALSAWVDLGFLGFFLLLFLLIYPLVMLLRGSSRVAMRALYFQSLGVCAMLLVLATFAKAYFYQLIPVAIGLYCRYAVSKRLFGKL